MHTAECFPQGSGTHISVTLITPPVIGICNCGNESHCHLVFVLDGCRLIPSGTVPLCQVRLQFYVPTSAPKIRTLDLGPGLHYFIQAGVKSCV